MKLNIVTKEPKEVLVALQNMYAKATVTHTPISSNIHSFEISEGDEPKVYSLEGLMELSDYYGIPQHDIRIY